MRSSRGVTALLLCLVLLVLLSGCLGINDSPGKRLVRKRCSVCHSTARIYAHKRGEKEWRQVVEAMIGHGAKLAPGEKEKIIRFLSENYGK